MTAPTLRPYRITCAGLQYTALATSACAAIVAAMDLHGTHIVAAKPLRQTGGAA